MEVFMKNESIRRFARDVRERLREAECHAVDVRKMLKSFQRLKGIVGRGEMDDAVQLAQAIEQLAHFGQHCSAADVVDVASQVEVLTSILRGEVDGLSAS
jgi:hypothetical protein